MIEELIIRTLCDTLPQNPADGVFLFGQTSDNQGSAFATSRMLTLNNQAQKILCLGTGPMSGYPGFENWKLAFNKFGVAEDMIEPVLPVPEDTEMYSSLKNCRLSICRDRCRR